MNDLHSLREEILASFTGEPVDLLDETSRGHLTMAFNDIAPAHLAIGVARTSLEVKTTSRSRLTSKELSSLTEHFARAVASIGREITDPKRGGQLSSADYNRAPVFTNHSATGTVIFLAPPEAPGMEGSDNGLTTSEQSLDRLVSLMPESSEDLGIADRILSLRRTSARAVSEVAAVARSTSGLTLDLRGPREAVSSVVTSDQAENIADLLSDTTEEFSTFTMKGRLDGMRFKRRMFYLEYGEDQYYSGSVDESLIERVKHLLDHEVIATMEKVTRTSLAGQVSRPTYRLVDVAEQQVADF